MLFTIEKLTIIRRTNSVENMNISADTSFSPDLGPPPVAHLDPETSSTKEGLSRAAPDRQGVVRSNVGRTELPPFSKSRRKKRESIDVSEITRANLFDYSADVDQGSENMAEKAIASPKAGVKRKLSMREDNQPLVPTTTSEVSNFVFSRRSSGFKPIRDLGTDDGRSSIRLNETSKGSPRSRARERPRSRNDSSIIERRTALAPSKPSTFQLSTHGNWLT